MAPTVGLEPTTPWNIADGGEPRQINSPFERAISSYLQTKKSRKRDCLTGPQARAP